MYKLCRRGLVAAAFFCVLALLASCGASGASAARTDDNQGKPMVVVTTAPVGALVADLVGSVADVVVLMPNGMDPHEWAPAASDMGMLTRAGLIVRVGLGLEAGMDKAIDAAQAGGVPVFSLTDHVPVRHAGDEDDHGAEDEHDHAAGDPHIWLSPDTLRPAFQALANQIADLPGLDAAGRAALAEQARDLDVRLAALDAELAALAAALPAERRVLVTGHESLGYFAERYGFHLIGAVVPGLSTQAGVSAANLAGLKAAMAAEGARVLFAEQGTPASAAEALARETGARVVTIGTHALPADGSYFTMLRTMAGTVCGELAR